jgi:predicted short-subunit dehydrogenase-like oxidoreductase (DUF2520 family)
MPPKKPKLSVSIIGAGRLGTALAIALEGAGYRIETIVNKRLASAKRAARLLDVPPRVLAAKELAQLQLPEVIIVATPDDHIAETAASLLKVDTNNSARCVVLHTSGALSSRVLAPLQSRKWTVGSLHPLISVSTPRMSLKGAFWSIEGDRKAREVARQLVRDLKGHSFTVSSKKKALYHAAALMTAGGVVALFDVAVEMMVESGVERTMARKVLQPLLESVVESLRTKDTAESLTGTFSRGDIKTVVQHLETLSASDLKEASQLYKILGQRSLKLASNIKPQSRRDDLLKLLSCT